MELRLHSLDDELAEGRASNIWGGTVALFGQWIVLIR